MVKAKIKRKLIEFFLNFFVEDDVFVKIMEDEKTG